MGDNFKFRKHRSKRRRKSSSVDVDGRPQDLESKTAGQDAGFGLEAPSSDEEVETNSTIRQQEHQHTQTGLYGGRRSSTGSSYQIRRSWDFASSNKENTNAEIPPSRSGGSVSVASSSRRNNPYARLKRSSSRLSSRHSLSSRGGSISIASATSSARMPQAAVHIVCAIAENLARETCVASLDAGTPISLQVTKQGNGQTYAETLAYLEMLQPHEILLNEGRKNSQLARKILQLYGYSDGGALNHADVLSGVYKDDSASTNSNTNGNGAAGAGIINDPNDPSSRGRTVIKFISRALFDQTKGAELLRKLAREDSYDSTVAEEYILLSSANAVLTYTQQNLGASISRRCLDLIINSGGNNRMAIDRSTLLQLELLANAKTGKTRQSLIATIDHTKTTVGSRLLRTNLMAPPCRADTIQARLDLVDTFLSSEDFFYTVLDHLESLPDIDKMLTNVAMVPKKTVRYKKGGGGEEVVVTERMASRGISALVCIKTTLAALPSFTTALVDQLSQLMANSGDTANQDDGMTAVTGRSSLLIGLGGGPQSTQAPKRHHLLQAIIFAMQQPALKEVLDSIADIFTESTTFTRNSHAMRHQECFALKSTSGEEDAGDGMMDILRKAFLRNVDDIHAKADEYAETHGIHVAVKYSTARGYFLSLPAEMAPTLPTIFIQPTKSGNAIHCTTEEVHSLNIRARDNVQDLLIMTHDRIQEVLAFARSKYDALASLSDAIALLDLCHGFADNVTMSKLLWCRPIITGDSTEDDASVNDPCTLAIRNGRYAIDVTGTGLVTMDGPGDTIPNDTYANADKYFTVISGINGSGKSQYLKQVAIIVLLGHCGSYVPAEQASIPIRTRLCVRMGTADDQEHNISSFMLEMKETAFICNNATPKSLILIDELGRATSNEDGVSIAWAVSEKLLAKRAMTFFVTHYPQLCQLATVYPCVQNQHLEAFVSRETNNAGISYTHKIAPGPCNVTSEYGIDMAMACGWPATAVENARKIETAVRDKLPRDGFCEVTSEQYDSPTTMEAKKKLLDICEKAQQLVNEESNLGSLRIKLQLLKMSAGNLGSDPSNIDRIFGPDIDEEEKSNKEEREKNDQETAGEENTTGPYKSPVAHQNYATPSTDEVYVESQSKNETQTVDEDVSSLDNSTSSHSGSDNEEDTPA